MDEARYLFNQTSYERKRVGRGAAAKKNGCKSKRCGMPSDYLTPAQKKKLNGECKVYDLSKPMTWKQFQKMPEDLQTEYIRKLADMGASILDVTAMMGATKGAYSSYMHDHHHGEKLFRTTKGKDNRAFKKWLAESGKTTDPEPKEGSNQAEPVQTEAVAKSENGAETVSGIVKFVGTPKDVFAKMSMILDEQTEYEITISFGPKSIP